MTLPVLDPVSECEHKAWAALVDKESIKAAADTRCVSEHTQRNQIKSLMSKLGVTTQIALVKLFYDLHYHVKIDLREIQKKIPIILLIITLVNSTAARTVRPRLRTRYEIESIA